MKIFIILSLCLFSALIQDKAIDTAKAPITLTEVELKQLAPVVQGFLDARGNYQKALNDARGVDLADCAKVTASIAKIQVTAEKLDFADLLAANLERRFAKAHGCEECKFTQDLKGLAKAPKATP